MKPVDRIRSSQSQTSNEDVSQSSRTLYRTVDNAEEIEICEQIEQEENTRRQKRRREETDEGTETEQQHEESAGGIGEEHADLPLETEPYFPESLACAHNRFQFNFDFFLLDELRLRLGLLPSDCTVPKTFTDVVECNNYCMEYVRGFSVPDGSGAPADHLNKEEMFSECGEPLEDLIRTGEATFDENLAKARTDRYGNVMILGAPKWSDVCPNFVHGFPRAMCPQSHGGFLRGNITVAARITNQVIRTMCPGDIASLCSKAALSGLGLTVSELFVARRAALKYCNKQQQPHRLVMAMVRYGIDFLTFSTLQPGTIADFMGAAATVSSNNYLTLQPSDNAEPSDSSSAESSDDSAVSDPDVSIDMSQYRTAETQAETILECSMHMMYRFVSKGRAALPMGPQKTAAPARVQVPSTSRPSQSSSAGRSKRKRKRTGGQAHVAPRPQAPSTSKSDEPIMDLRQRLSQFPRINMARIPKPSTLNVMKVFMTKNVPLSPEEVQDELRRRPDVDEDEDAARVGRHIQAERRTTRVAQLLQKLWELERCNCVCPVPTNPEGDAETNDSGDIQCPYQLEDINKRGINPDERPCRATDCKVCLLFADNQYFTTHCVRATRNKNRRLQFMLSIAPSMTDLMWSKNVQTSAAKTREIRSIWRELLCVTDERLVGILNVGHLVQILPALESLVLTSGWSKFWAELRKLGAALAYQDNNLAKLATLVYIRTEFVPENAWKAVLTAGAENEKEVWRFLRAGNADQEDDQAEGSHAESGHEDHDEDAADVL